MLQRCDIPFLNVGDGCSIMESRHGAVMEGEKEVLCQLGFDFGCARPPFSELSDSQKDFLRREVTERL